MKVPGKLELVYALVTLAALGVGFGVPYVTHKRGSAAVRGWQKLVDPGELSPKHRFLSATCESCHTPHEGATADKCIACHANNQALLQRQPTAFHANAKSCRDCHVEHRGELLRPTQMDHEALVRIGLAELKAKPSGSAERASAAKLKTWIAAHKNAPENPHPRVTAREATLNCTTCHATKDKHQGFFGASCAECHSTSQWTITEFQHPPASSMDCAQCHQAPPSHYMEHFNMVSKKVAHQEDSEVGACCGPAQVDQCYRCHQTTSWNDIKGVGYYKHH